MSDLNENLGPQGLHRVIFVGHLKYLGKKPKCMCLQNGVRYSEFDEVIGPQGIHIVICQVLAKSFSCLLAAILNYSVKCKNVFISEIV